MDQRQQLQFLIELDSRLSDGLTEFSLSLSTSKKLLTSLRGDGIIPTRKIRRAFRSQFAPKEPSAIRKLIAKHVPPPWHEVIAPKKGISIQKIYSSYGNAPVNTEGLAPMYKVAHEGGHATRPVEALENMRRAKRNQIGGRPVRAHRISLDEERRANRNAMSRLRRVGASEAEVAGYRTAVKPAFKTHKRSAATAHIATQRAEEVVRKALVGDFRGASAAMERPASIAERRRLLSDSRAAIRGWGFSSRARYWRQ